MTNPKLPPIQKCGWLAFRCQGLTCQRRMYAGCFSDVGEEPEMSTLQWLSFYTASSY